MRFAELNEKTLGLTFRDEVTGAIGDQINGELSAYRGNQPVGYISWSSYNDKTSITYMEVAENERRNGIGTALVKELEKRHGSDVKWGGMTDDGTELYKFIHGELPSEKRKEDVDVFYGHLQDIWAGLNEGDYSEFYEEQDGTFELKFIKSKRHMILNRKMYYHHEVEWDSTANDERKAFHQEMADDSLRHFTDWCSKNNFTLDVQ